MKTHICLAVVFSLYLSGCSPEDSVKKKKPTAKKTTEKKTPKESRVLKIAKDLVKEKGTLNQGYSTRFKKDVNGIPLLVWAVSHRDIEAVKYLLDNGADPNIKLIPRSTDTAIFESTPSVDIENTPAAYNERRETTKKICELLIEAGADVKHKNKIKETLLHKASSRGREDICALIIEKGADIKAKDVIGNTPLHLAAKYGCCKVVELLILKGADVNDRNLLKKTPLQLAQERLDEDLFKKIRKDMPSAYPYRDYDKVIEMLKIAGGK